MCIYHFTYRQTRKLSITVENLRFSDRLTLNKTYVSASVSDTMTTLFPLQNEGIRWSSHAHVTTGKIWLSAQPSDWENDQRLTSHSGTQHTHTHTHTHTHPFNGPFSRTIQVSRYQKGKTKLDFTGARDRVAVASAGLYASLHLAIDR